MLSKFLRSTAKQFVFKTNRRIKSGEQSAKHYADWIPPTQYDTPISKKFHMGHVLKEYWETIPLFLSTFAALGLLFFSIAWACRNKVDVVFSTNNRDYISRTMDLRNPSTHKLLTINQRYEPWPEMQDLLDKMKSAEKRALVRAQSCNQP